MSHLRSHVACLAAGLVLASACACQSPRTAAPADGPPLYVFEGSAPSSVSNRPRRLQLNATSFSALQDSHVTRRNPCSRAFVAATHAAKLADSSCFSNARHIPRNRLC
jgi:hypothetical protein